MPFRKLIPPFTLTALFSPCPTTLPSNPRLLLSMPRLCSDEWLEKRGRGAHDHLVRRARLFCSQGAGYGKQLNLSATVTLGTEKVTRVVKR